jgi:hypothetical protein
VISSKILPLIIVLVTYAMTKAVCVDLPLDDILALVPRSSESMLGLGVRIRVC